MVWYSAGKGCFQYDFYYLLRAKTREHCIKKCQDDVRCALVAYYEKKQKCSLCADDKYKRKTSCGYHVELIAKGTSF
jgi:hypothetical protein